jgi:FkbM family methyltransferase
LVKRNFVKQLTRRLRGHWRRKALGRHGIAIVAETKNGLLAVQAGDFNVSRSLLLQGEYDWPQINWLIPLLNPSSRVIFAGAHVGALLVPIVRATSPQAVLAFEPSPRNFRLLTMNLNLNGIGGEVARNMALGERPCTIQFTENRINTGNSRIAAADGEITVAMETLDRTVPADRESIDLIVMDTEGSEAAAMRGGQATLAKTRNLYVEFAPEQLREQGSSAVEFAEAAAKHFKSAYVFGAPILFLGPDAFPGYFEALQHERDLLMNVLFTRDLEADPRRMIASCVSHGS